MKPFLSQCCLPAWSRLVMEAAQMADGVSKDQLHPMNMDHAFAKITEIKSHVSKWWTTSAQPLQLLLDSEARMCMT